MEVNVDMPVVNESSRRGMKKKLSKDFGKDEKDVKINTPLRVRKKSKSRKKGRLYNCH